MFNIFLVADSKSTAQSIKGYLQRENNVLADYPDKISKHLSGSFEPDVVILAEERGKKFIIHSLDRIRRQNVNAPVILYTSERDPEFILSVMRRDIADYLFTKNTFDQLQASIISCVQRRFPFRYVDESEQEDQVPGLYGYSKEIREVKHFIINCAPTDATVMLYGESGTGKTHIAKLIHEYSNRSKFQIRAINCAAIPDSLIESEFFGSEVGAFTGAVKRTGIMARTHRGTLFLDEIGDLQLLSQAKLLQVLDEKRYTPLGGDKEFEVNVRVISATNKNMKKMIEKQEFRSDLFYRMSVLSCTLPPLRARKIDIPFLAYTFLRRLNKNQFFSMSAVDKLINYSWPGNVRELKTCVSRVSITSRKDRIDSSDIIF